MTMFRNWTQQVAAWLQRQGSPAARRRSRSRRPLEGFRSGAMISQLEVLESRRLLTNLVAVNVQGNSINLTDVSRGRASSGDNFSVAYTSTQAVLTGTNGTSFRVNGQTMSSYTVDLTGPASISMRLNPRGNTVTVSGDGMASLDSLNINLGAGRQNNSLTLTKVIANSLNVNGGRRDDNVTLNQSTINGNLSANLGRSSGDKLDLESTTVTGNVRDQVSQLVVNQSTISGNLNDVESARNSTMTSTASTYSGAVSIRMGQNGTVDMLGAVSGPNHFSSSVSITGTRRRQTTVNEPQNSVVFDLTPKYRFANVNGPSTTIATPTVNSQSASTATPTVTGTYDSVHGPLLSVKVSGTTYTLGTSSQLTTPSAGKWSLNLATAPLTSQTTTVTVASSDKQGDIATGTGTITNEQSIISNYLTKNNLTATTTASGLDYVIKTKGTGAIPTSGQSVTVNYTGYVLNSDGTKGTEFDSNIDSQFKHVTPFSFKLGAGQVITGWDQAFALLPVGTVAELLIPSDLAYGTAGSGSLIPGNSILIFDVTVVSAV